MERIEMGNDLDMAYQNYVSIIHQHVDVELETTHPQQILEEVPDDEIMNVEEQISRNVKNKSFYHDEWDDNTNETTEGEEWRMCESNLARRDSVQ